MICLDMTFQNFSRTSGTHTSHGYAPGYEVHEMEEMEMAVALLSQDLADRIEGIVVASGFKNKTRYKPYMNP